MEGFMKFKRGSLRLRKVEMKNYWFVLKQDPTSAEFQYVLSWYQNDQKTKLKGSLNLLPSMTLLTEVDRQFLLGYYFVVKTPDNEVFHFSGQSRSAVERWTSKIREAIMTDLYAGTTRSNKFMKERNINIYISNASISFLHPLTEETILSWRLSQIISFVFNETEFSFSTCSKCNKCSGRFAQQVSLETGIFVVSSLEERLAALYPEDKLYHEKTISGDVYRVPHSCARIDKEGVSFTRPAGRPKTRTSKMFSFPLSCISAGPSRLPKSRTPLNQPKYKRCPTPTSFTEPPMDSPPLPFTRHSSMPSKTQPPNHSYDTSSLYLKSAITSPISVASSRPDYSFHPSHSQEDLLSVAGPHCLPKSPSLNAQRYIHGRPTHSSKPRLQSHLSVPPIAPCDWNYTLHTTCRSRHGSLGDNQEDITDSSYERKSMTPLPNSSRIMYTEDTLTKLSIISELEKSFHAGGPMGYESHSLPIRRRRFPVHRPRAALRSNTFQFPIGVLPVTLAKEPNFSEGGKIIINNTEYQVPRMVPEDEPDEVYNPHLRGEGSDPSSDTSASSPAGVTGYPKQKRCHNKRKQSHSSTFSSTTLSEALPYSQDDSDSGPDRITLL